MLEQVITFLCARVILLNVMGSPVGFTAIQRWDPSRSLYMEFWKPLKWPKINGFAWGEESSLVKVISQLITGFLHPKSSQDALPQPFRCIPGTDDRTHSLTQAGQITLMNDQADVR